MGKGGGGGAAAPPKFVQLRFFGQEEKFGPSQFLKKFACVCACCFFFKVLRLKTYLRSAMGQQRVSNIALTNTEREYANSVLNNDIDRTIGIFVICNFHVFNRCRNGYLTA